MAAFRERRRNPHGSRAATETPARETPAAVTPAHATVAALYVQRDGAYSTLPDVDLWPVDRDATCYSGPWPVVAHPPCAPWGFYRHSSCTRERADLAVRAVDQVRQHGGVLEHPANSHLWVARELPRPDEPPDRWGGWTVLIRQSWWGHAAQKATWLYIVGRTDLPPLPPPVSFPASSIAQMRKHERERTPARFAAWLTDLAKGCSPPSFDRRKRRK